MNTKGLITSFALDENTGENIRDLAEYYNESGLNELLIFDLSKNDEEHEMVISKIKEFAQVCELNVYGAGNIDRMEDVKKLIYAGCKMAALNLAKPSNIELMEEVALKFGKDKIAVCLKTIAEYQENKEQIEKYASTLVCLNEEMLQVQAQTPLKVLLKGELERSEEHTSEL